jgi:hypothetical protein
VARITKETSARDVRLQRLARSIEALKAKDDLALARTSEITDLRRAAATDLYAICADFVNSVNRLLEHKEVQLDPPDYDEDAFRDDVPNLVQINVRGRILQVAFRATPELISTEDFRVPYTLEGTVRAFNQELLDKDLIEEQLIFFTLERHKRMWRFFDARTYRSGPFDQEYLIGLMEQLL